MDSFVSRHVPAFCRCSCSTACSMLMKSRPVPLTFSSCSLGAVLTNWSEQGTSVRHSHPLLDWHLGIIVLTFSMSTSFREMPQLFGFTTRASRFGRPAFTSTLMTDRPI